MTKSKIPRTALLTLFVGALRIAICRSVFTAQHVHSLFDLKDALHKCLQQSKKGDCSQSEYGPIELWNVSHVTTMAWLFEEDKLFNADISNWNVAQVVDMSGIFFQAKSFNQDISKWKVSRVTDMSQMFYQATLFNQDISEWNVSHVDDMSGMFFEATSFNQDISKWVVSRVTDMSRMFKMATSFAQKLCGPAWIRSTAKRDEMFLDSPSGSIESTCTTTATATPTPTSPAIIVPVAVIAGVILVITTIVLVLVFVTKKSHDKKKQPQNVTRPGTPDAKCATLPTNGGSNGIEMVDNAHAPRVTYLHNSNGSLVPNTIPSTAGMPSTYHYPPRLSVPGTQTIVNNPTPSMHGSSRNLIPNNLQGTPGSQALPPRVSFQRIIPNTSASSMDGHSPHLPNNWHSSSDRVILRTVSSTGMPMTYAVHPSQLGTIIANTSAPSMHVQNYVSPHVNIANTSASSMNGHSSSESLIAKNNPSTGTPSTHPANHPVSPHVNIANTSASSMNGHSSSESLIAKSNPSTTGAPSNHPANHPVPHMNIANTSASSMNGHSSSDSLVAKSNPSTAGAPNNHPTNQPVAPRVNIANISATSMDGQSSSDSLIAKTYPSTTTGTPNTHPTNLPLATIANTSASSMDENSTDKLVVVYSTTPGTTADPASSCWLSLPGNNLDTRATNQPAALYVNIANTSASSMNGHSSSDSLITKNNPRTTGTPNTHPGNPPPFSIHRSIANTSASSMDGHSSSSPKEWHSSSESLIAKSIRSTSGMPNTHPGNHPVSQHMKIANTSASSMNGHSSSESLTAKTYIITTGMPNTHPGNHPVSQQSQHMNIANTSASSMNGHSSSESLIAKSNPSASGTPNTHPGNQPVAPHMNIANISASSIDGDSGGTVGQPLNSPVHPSQLSMPANIANTSMMSMGAYSYHSQQDWHSSNGSLIVQGVSSTGAPITYPVHPSQLPIHGIIANTSASSMHLQNYHSTGTPNAHSALSPHMNIANTSASSMHRQNYHSSGTPNTHSAVTPHIANTSASSMDLHTSQEWHSSSSSIISQPRPNTSGAPNMYTTHSAPLSLHGVIAVTPIGRIDLRTFATSNYKRFYDESAPAEFQHDLLGAVNTVLDFYAKRANPTLSHKDVEAGVHAAMVNIQQDAFMNGDDLKSDVSAAAEYLWTSGRKHRVVNNMQLCSVLNAVIRDDIAAEIHAATIIFRSINTRRVRRVNEGANTDIQSFPPNGETWRGGGFRNQHKAFFDGIKGKKYRVPAFLATSKDRSVAASFAFKAPDDHPCAIWRITFDPRGKDHPEHRVRHMTFVSKTLVKGEHEYLFAPYSVFTLKKIKWSSKSTKPHEFTIRAACDNKEEDENLPLAPWY